MKSVGALLAGSAVMGGPGRVDRDTWARAVGPRVAERAQPERVRDGILTVRVASPIWAQELSLLAPTIILRLRALGAEVSSLRFQTGAVETPDIAVRRTRPPHRAELPASLLERLARLEDAKLRDAIHEAASLSIGAEEAAKATSRSAPRGPGSAAPRTAPKAPK